MTALGAIIAAGGHGQRLQLGYPKSSLKHRGQSLIWWTSYSLVAAGVKHIDVYVDDAQWVNIFSEELRNFVQVRVVQDFGYESTFLLFREHCSRFSKCLFTYGHAPRPPQVYTSLLTHDVPIIACRVETSSMRHPLRLLRDKLLEPPYLIQPSSVELDTARNWQSFFERNMERLTLGVELGIGEFNTKAEWLAYRAYMQDKLRTTDSALN
jgi:hypothetical protein